MSEPSPTQAVNDRAVARAREEITRRTAEGEFGQPPNTDLRDRAWMEIFEQELSNRHPRTMGRPLLSSFFRRARLRSDPLTRGDLAAVVSTRSHSSPHVDPGRVMADGDTAEVELEEIRYGNRVFSGRSAHARHQHPRNKDLIAHFKSKGDSVSWGIAESIEKYEEDTKKKVSWGTDIASLYDQETERELAREVENRIEEALLSARRPRVQNFEDFEEATRALFRQLGASNASV
jgi:hypothetical protein